ncbi:hypothetical protein JRQ81_009768 [Phrynocephalus forsythii]|uniref:Transmembrane protein 88B n=1 Tax=Phrynocephalus forsythii TaxID=171643 RepID=A0A9Q0X967_9SAUR|nr:hypothetical protein JRQ81_009768 [Phrynocephalus forsythii]
MSDPEMDDYEGDNLPGTWGRIPGLPPYHMEDQLLPLERRSPCGCLAWACLLAMVNLAVFLGNFLLLAAIFLVVLLPSIVVAYFGFQCHSRTVLDDNSSSALIILSFVMISPLIVVAMAIYCGLVRHLRLFLCFQPCAQAVYKGVQWRWYKDGGMCGRTGVWNQHVKAWV